MFLSWNEALHHQTFGNHAQDVTLCVPVHGISCPPQIQWHVIEIKHFPKSFHQFPSANFLKGRPLVTQ